MIVDNRKTVNQTFYSFLIFKQLTFISDFLKYTFHQRLMADDKVDKVPSSTVTTDLEREFVGVYSTSQGQTEQDILETVKRLRVGKQIGLGGYGIVYAMESLEGNNRPLACKVINLADKLRNHFTSELNLKRCSHPNLIYLVDQFIIDHRGYLVMEYANGGTISALIANGTPISEHTAKKYFSQILDGLMYLHMRRIAHRDLKLDNLLLVISSPPTSEDDDEENKDSGSNKTIKTVKITDFGLSVLAYDPEKGKLTSGSFAGTRPYMAPEIVRIRVHQQFRACSDTCFDFNPFVADIWSLGVCLYEMLTGSLPFLTRNDETLLRMQEGRELSFPKSGHLSSNARALVGLMLEPNPDRRVDPFGIKFHPWLS